MYADIIIDITHEKLDKVFQYRVPEELEGDLRTGAGVIVPFGRGNRETKGYIVGFSETCDYDAEKIKDILRTDTSSVAIEARLVALAAWMKEYYGGTMIQALKTVLPIKRTEQQKEQRILKRCISREAGEKKLEEYLHKNQKARARLMAALLDDEEVEYSLISQKLNITLTVVRALEEQGVLEIKNHKIYRNPVKEKEQQQHFITYTEEQESAIRTFENDYKKGIRKTYLLYGVTGSGKTEVYMEMIRQVVKEKRQAIVLIPEIALTYQTVMRFYRTFGERVSIMNSRLSAGERYDQMMRAKKGEIDVMIGPRSALFTPFENLGLIVIDEEHEGAYKSENVPKYHAREVAAKLCNITGATLVLGSATPSLESYFNAQTGKYKLHRLTSREKGKLAQVSVVDMRKELKNDNKSMFSMELKQLINDRLEKKQQTMLFINRRGYAGFVSCRECGEAVKCPHCDVTLKAHNNGKMVCHYCGYEEPIPRLCPKCGSKYIAGFGIGTQKVETMIKKEFPQAKVLRMDFDTTSRKGGHEEILSAFANHQADILVGTQMIVKGHDFPDVTLVGILAADMSLYASDYTAAEKTFQLLTQAAGRAGRGKEKGQVVIQTYSPDNYSIESAAKQDYEEFYQEELAYRQLMQYPPVAAMTEILIQSEDEELLDRFTDALTKYINKLKEAKFKQLMIIGPAKPPVAKINDVYRRMIYLKSLDKEKLIRMSDYIQELINTSQKVKGITLQFNVRE